ISIVRDEDEWAAWNVVGDSVRHIELKDWADVMLLAPMSANTLGKLANGLADNLLTCVARAWIMTKPFVFAPAMNTDMWNHPITAKQLRVLAELGYKMVPPVEKKLACGVVGTMAEM
uniref:Flavoprotein domain-containing protein n=1 Tax=Phytophthora ramorum TaxID=164328 RepID=H3G7F4_PHYRM